MLVKRLSLYIIIASSKKHTFKKLGLLRYLTAASQSTFDAKRIKSFND